MCAYALNAYNYIRNSHICIQCVCTRLAVIWVWLRNSHRVVYKVATSSRLPQNIGLFCKRALQKRRYSAKETYIFDEPTNHSHLIVKCAFNAYAFVVGREGEETLSILNRTVNTKQSHVFLRHMRTNQVCRRSLLLVWHVGCKKTHIFTCSRIHKTFWHPTHTCATQFAASGATLSAVSYECDMSHIWMRHDSRIRMSHVTRRSSLHAGQPYSPVCRVWEDTHD